ncbi:HWE histidine kinase domain-containing protein [Cognatishimia maritima]|uniref:histidine kinase n=1 Tax=Cognatishimia maritima TaxID=870908 RepID=A0A1M5PM25_9RHOB|nr:HWE histidine kinase domain-containing protein [Cognatishimia maritima]SHH02812.1 Bacteriophytochrome (light-regulated signal transduction histidine kinase) [Cognatishimia maritima]
MSEQPMQSDYPSVDLTTCDQEPIHIIGEVQDFGCLLAVSADWIIAHASTNCAAMLRLEDESLAGRPVTEVLSAQALHDLRTRMQIMPLEDGPVRVFSYDLLGDGALFDISIHKSGRLFIFEFEPREPNPASHDPALVQSLFARIQRHSDLGKMANEAARGLKALSGFDRVMVYQFEKDDSGTVIAEAREPEIEPFLGLRYPASDIPKQARELYKRSLLRIIPDINAPVHQIDPIVDPNGTPLDLSLAVTRSVSKIHLEYLGNMGVAASMSVSIIVNGRLWGLFACHHYSPRYITYENRTSVELFAQLFNFELTRLEMTDELTAIDRSRALHDRLMPRLSSGHSLFAAFEELCSGIGEVIDFDGAAIFSDGHYKSVGIAPAKEPFLDLARFLNSTPPGQVYHTDQLALRYPAAAELGEDIAGLLAIPVSRKPRDYFVLFRQEIVTSVTWAGKPEKNIKVGPNGIRLTPRKSFEAWQEIMKGRSQPWRTREQRTAEALRTTLIEVVLKMTDENNAERKRAQDQQELLIAELNHRVRNVLNLIRGLVSQGKENVDTVDTFGEILDARIHALSRAHDQLTDYAWDWSPLGLLIRNETDAFLAGKANRVEMSGDYLDLASEAFTCVALVVHELVTNSVKYGSLSDSSGRIEIHTDLLPNGDAVLLWKEHDGPVVSAPTRKGFGTTIIEKSIPFELKGSAEVQFDPDGLEAKFVLPREYVRPSTKQKLKDAVEHNTEVKSDVNLSGRALVVEDNMIIAMDAADMLEQLGAEKAETTSTVIEALAQLESNPPNLLLADMNLGKETSDEVVKRAIEMGIPVVLATGFSDTEKLLGQYPQVKLIKKPYAIEQLSAVLATLFPAGGDE